MLSLLCAGPIWGGIQQLSGRVQPNATPAKPPTSMSHCFRLQNLCIILMFLFDTYVRACDVWDLCLCLILVLNTYVCDGYLCLWSRFYVCVGYLCLWWYLWCIYVIYMWYLLFVWMENKKQIKKYILVTLPSVTLGKVTNIYLFYLFFVFHPHKHKISHIYHIYTSQISSQT